MNTTRKLAPLIACVAASFALAACGSSSSGSSSSASASTKTGATGTAAGRTKLVACLKQHGVTLPSRPGGFGGQRFAPGGGGPGTTGRGGRPPGGRRGGGGFAGRFRSDPKLQAAFKACGANFGGRRFAGAPQHAAITRFATCVRQHGYQLPKPNFSGKGPVFPARIETNAKFKSASRACQGVLAPGPAGGAGQSTSASSSA